MKSYCLVILICGMLITAIGCKSKSISHPTVTISPSSISISVSKQPAVSDVDHLEKIQFEFNNGTSEAIEFGYESCVYYKHWKTDSPLVIVPNWPCLRNIGARKESLKPGESFKGAVPIFVSPSAPAGIIRLRLAFNPGVSYSSPSPGGTTKPLGEFVSNEIQIKVDQ